MTKKDEIYIELENPSTKKKTHFKSKKREDGQEVIDKITENDFACAASENAFGIAQNNMSKRLQKEIQETINETYSSFKKSMKSAVLSSLGFEKDNWGSSNCWRIDHCNGRMSLVTEHVSHMFKSFFKELDADSVIALITEKEKEQMKDEIGKECKDLLKRVISEKIRSATHTAINDCLAKTVREVIEEEIKTYKDSITETIKK